MIRVIFILGGVLLLWLWLFSPFSRRTKNIATAIAVLVSVALIAHEYYNDKPRYGLIKPDEVSVCDLQVNHQYRTDYKVKLCIENTSSKTIKSLGFAVQAKQCDATSQCSDLEIVTRDVLLTVAPNEQARFDETLRFNKVAADAKDVAWSVSITDVKAVP